MQYEDSVQLQDEDSVQLQYDSVQLQYEYSVQLQDEDSVQLQYEYSVQLQDYSVELQYEDSVQLVHYVRPTFISNRYPKYDSWQNLSRCIGQNINTIQTVLDAMFFLTKHSNSINWLWYLYHDYFLTADLWHSCTQNTKECINCTFNSYRQTHVFI
jgi:hypothetical protein